MSDEPLFGQAALERDAGFVPMPEPKKKEEETSLTTREAAEQYAAQTPEPVKFVYKDGDGKPMPFNVYENEKDDDGEPVKKSNEILTVERAVDDLTEFRKGQAEEAEKEAAAKVREELGVKDRPEPKSTVEPPIKTAETDLETALKNPEIQEALKSQVAANEAEREQLRSSLNAAVQISQNSFISQFPEFANTSPDQHSAIAAAIAQQNPGRWAAIQAAVMNSASLFEQQRTENNRAAEKWAEDFKSFAKDQDAVFDKAMQGVSVEMQQRARAEVFAGFKEAGLEQDEVQRLFKTDRTLRHAAFQRVIFEAGLYRAQQKAYAQFKPVPKDIPPVVRPGTSQPRGNPNDRGLQAAQNKFNLNPSLQNAADLHTAKQKAKRG